MGAVTLALECAFGASLGDALIYAGYEGAFVVVPGCLVYAALSDRSDSSLRVLAMGWALGYVLEVLAFVLTAATDRRGLFAIYPVVVAGFALFVCWRRRSLRRALPPSGPGVFAAVLTAVCILAVAYVAASSFPTVPLPGSRTAVYSLDSSAQLAIAGDAKHHWPIQDPNLAGEPLPYHFFVHAHLAAASQVTGLGLPLVYFRLFICPLVVALVLLFAMAGEGLLGSRYAGLLAAGLTVFIGEIRLDFRQSLFASTPFFGLFFTLMLISPSFLFGLVLFVPLIVLVGERLTGRLGVGSWPHWLLVALFLYGSSGAKVSIPPVVMLALGLYGLCQLLTKRRVPAEVLWIAALALLIYGCFYLTQYFGHSSGLGIAPFDVFTEFPGVLTLKSGLAALLPSLPGKHLLLTVIGVVVGLLGLLAPTLAGLPWLFGRGRPLTPERQWLLAILAAGLLCLVLLSGKGTGNQLYLVFYGLVGGYLASADGLRLAWIARPKRSLHYRRMALLFIGWLTMLAMILALPLIAGRPAGNAGNSGQFVLLYVALVASLALLYVATSAWSRTGRWGAVSLVCAALLLVGSLDTPAGRLWPSLISRPSTAQTGKGVTPRLYHALAWIRDRSAPGSVIAVNSRNRSGSDYAALAERRVFVGASVYSQRARDEGFEEVQKGIKDPFADRRSLNDALFTRGDPQALASVVRRYGVRLLLIDRVNGFPVDLPLLKRDSVVMFENHDATVLKVM